MYHSIITNKSEGGKHNIYVLLKNIRQQLIYLKENKYRTITFRDISEGKVSDFNKTIILTFDDGYEDNYDLLFPLLKEFNFKAVIFLVTQLSFNKWGTDEGEPKRNLMTKKQILEMDAYGIEFGGHTCTHIALNTVTDDVKLAEIMGCKQSITDLLTKLPISFAYPFGGIDASVKRIIKESGFKYGIATKSGPIDFHEDPYQIRRIEISSRTSMFGFKRKVSGHYLTRKYFLFKIK